MPTTITSFPIGVPSGQTIYAQVQDISGGYSLYEKNADTAFNFPASTGKLMTALLIYEYKSSVLTSETVTATADDVGQPDPALTMDLTPLEVGDIITWEGLLYAIFLKSGADACELAARVIGDLIYTNAGSTGTQGVTRFLERMNARATELGMTGTTYVNTYGGSETTIVRNITTARDTSKVCGAVMIYSAIQTIAGSPTAAVNVTGTNPRTLNFTNYNRFINGPTAVQAGIKDTNVYGGKNGVWLYNSIDHYSLSILWNSPNGIKVVFTVFNSISLLALMMDVRGLIYSILRDFPYLTDGTNTGADANFSDVKMLVGFDSSVIDESSVGRSLTVTSVPVGTPVIASAGGGVYSAKSDHVYAADATDLRMTSGDGTVEEYFFGDGSSPGGNEYVFVCKADHTTPAREYLLNYFNNVFSGFISSDGTSWTNIVSALTLTANEVSNWFNGAPRHVAIVKSGSTISFYFDGEKMANTITVGTIPGTTSSMAIGYYADAASAVGRVDEYRFTKGLARYTAAMVTLTARMFPRTATAPNLPGAELRLNPARPFGLAGALPLSRFGPQEAFTRPNMGFALGGPPPAEQVVAAAGASQVYLPPPSGDFIVSGPWSKVPFVPVRLEANRSHLSAPPFIPAEVQPSSPGTATIVPGPWNRFGFMTPVLGTLGGNAPIPENPTVPPPPPSVPIGPSRSAVPSIPRAPKESDDRTRPHIDKTATLLNSLLRQGYIRKNGDDFEIVGGGFALERAPTPQDDASVGAVVNSTFVNLLTNEIYICVNNSIGSAVWLKLLTE